MLAAMYSASTKLDAANAHFLLNQDITPKPKLKQQPKALFLSPASPAQSKSTNSYNINSPSF
jgi:hypothetical protein